MNRTAPFVPTLLSALAALTAAYGTLVSPHSPGQEPAPAAVQAPQPASSLGAFSVSLTVKNLAASRAFYEKLGFVAFAGEQKQKWIVMRNGSCVIGLFQGMFDKNILTFNPGWSQDTKVLASFEDVRALQKKLEEKGVKLTTRADEKGKGPASFTCDDPDGNQILVDQHVD
ncbi:MAG: VOC family protein [Planctomycetes bacterium]|nr:VOC family protein [Planctomycetota bacterium]